MNKRTIAFAAAAALMAGCATHGAGTSSLLPQSGSDVRSAAKTHRGQVLSLKKTAVITPKQMTSGTIGGILVQLSGTPKCAVDVYAVQYATIGVKGEPATATAAFMVPGAKCGTGPFPLVGYAHGTNLATNQLITNPKTSNPNWTAPDQDPVVVAMIYASQGYAVAATDYLGLGGSDYPFHPYLHVASEATSVIDALRATRSAAKTLNVSLMKGTGVFLSGHSQGGQVAVGTQRAIESGAYAGEFSVLRDGASSGPYALSQTFQDSLRKQSQDAPILATYILTGYQKIYGNIYSDPSTIFKAPYSKGIDTLLPVHSYAAEAKLIGTTLPLKLSDLITTSWKKSFLTDPTNAARVAAADNDLLSGWVPKGPIDLCGGSRDPEVEFKNAIAAERYFKKAGATITPLRDVNDFIPPTVPFTDYHVTVALFCLSGERVAYWDPMVAAMSARR